jgi:uncharacterized membrane protein YkoI
MSETTLTKLSWALVGLIGISAVALFGGWIPAGASSDHEVAKALRQEGTILPLSELLAREELAGVRVIEAELEHEHGRAVYELELLHDNGRVYERYYDATTGEPLGD